MPGMSPLVSSGVGTQGPLTPYLLLCPMPCSLQVSVGGILTAFF